MNQEELSFLYPFEFSLNEHSNESILDEKKIMEGIDHNVIVD